MYMGVFRMALFVEKQFSLFPSDVSLILNPMQLSTLTHLLHQRLYDQGPYRPKSDKVPTSFERNHQFPFLRSRTRR